MAFKSIFSLPEPPNEVTWAEGRLLHRTYISRSFTLNLPASRDHGEPARYVTKVFDEPTSEDASTTELDSDTEEYIVATTPRGRKQIQLQVAREAGNVRRLVIQRVPTNPGSSKLEVLLDLDRTGATRLMDVISMVNSIPVEGDTSVRIDDQVLQDFFRDPEAMTALYGRDPGSLRRLIELDASAADVIAISRRRTVVGFSANFSKILTFLMKLQPTTIVRKRCGRTYLRWNPGFWGRTWRAN